MREIIVIAHDMRSTHNVGSLLRTANGLGITKVYLTGYTPYPVSPDDARLPHEAQKINRQISKTALGAEKTVLWEHHPNLSKLLENLKNASYSVVGLEQTLQAVPLDQFEPPQKLVLLLGREVEGIDPDILRQTDSQVVIPMFGTKESFNVIQAAAMALYHCRFYPSN